MTPIRPFVCLVALSLAGACHAGEVYKWTDAQGRVHFGDKPPKDQADKAKPVEVKVAPVSEAARQAANERTAKLKAGLGQAGTSSPAAANEPGVSLPSAMAGHRACQEAWRSYLESQACFNGQRLDNGKLAPDAAEKCTAVPQPQPCN